MEKVNIHNHTFGGALWFAGWLFTLGYLKLVGWQVLFAIVIWPYYLGSAFAL